MSCAESAFRSLTSRCICVAIVMLFVVPAAYYLLVPLNGTLNERGRLPGDYLRAWDVPLSDVHKATEDTLHYDLRTRAGTAESPSLLPRGGGMLHLGHDEALFSVSMFHQLRCLDIIGRELVARMSLTPEVREKLGPPSELAHHCMNYLRQMILCRADTTLESATNPYGPHIVARAVTHTCKDWTAVYAAAEDDYAQHANSTSSAIRV